MNDPTRDFNEVIRTIVRTIRVTHVVHITFRQALDFSLKELHKSGELDKSNHLTGQQLLDGIRLYAIDQYGPMARPVLAHWGIRECRDFGNIVFNLVECKVLGKTDQDSVEDFSGGYKFNAAFDKPFRPERIIPTIKKPRMG